MVPERLDRYRWVTGSRRAVVAAELRRRYEQGQSIRQLATAIGRSYGWVHGMLCEVGVPLRGRGGPRPRRVARAGP